MLGTISLILCWVPIVNNFAPFLAVIGLALGVPPGCRVVGFVRGGRISCRSSRSAPRPGRQLTEYAVKVDSVTPNGNDIVAMPWHDCGMSRTRLSTTVDDDLLQAARRVRSGDTDAAMIDEALSALLARHRSAEIAASYNAYDEHPLDEPDEWGDLASFRQAAGRS